MIPRMPEFEGTSDALSFQAALEDAVRKAYTAYQRRTHTDPLFSYVVKRVTGHLRTLTVVIETVQDVRDVPPAPAAAPAPAAEPSGTGDPVRELLDKHRRNEPLTPSEQALLDLLRDDPKGGS
jgi:hypothetical protein